jgi:hypothetical protein
VRHAVRVARRQVEVSLTSHADTPTPAYAERRMRTTLSALHHSKRPVLTLSRASRDATMTSRPPAVRREATRVQHAVDFCRSASRARQVEVSLTLHADADAPL